MNNIASAQKKSKGPIRFEAVIPFLTICVGTYFYFLLIFDLHVKSLVEFSGYHLVGAEVNIGSFKSSFLKGTIQIKDIQVTNPDVPNKNMVQISEIRFGMLWDALLRAKFVVDEIAVEGVAVDSNRKKPGKVKPPPPPEPESTEEDSAIKKELNKAKDLALSKTAEGNSDNALGNLASSLQGGSFNIDSKTIEDKLIAKKMVKEFEVRLQDRQKLWNEALAKLPQQKQVNEYSNRLKAVKSKDFKSPQEVQDSVKQYQSIFSEIDTVLKQVSSSSIELQKSISDTEAEFKQIDSQIKADIKSIESYFKIPSLDVKDLSKSIFGPYISPWIGKLNHYKSLANKYIPPGLMKSKSEKVEEIPPKPHPRAKGVTYEFGRVNSYPMFWIRRVLISSKSSPNLGTGDLAGKITDLTSNQTLVGHPTVIQLEGDFPSSEIFGFRFNMSIDGIKSPSLITSVTSIDKYPIGEQALVQSKEIGIKMQKSVVQLKLKGQLEGLKEFKIEAQNQINNPEFIIESSQETLRQMLDKSFAAVKPLTLDAEIRGTLPHIVMSINLNLGAELAKSFSAQVQQKINELRERIQTEINQQIGKEKAKAEEALFKAKSQVASEVKKAQDQLEKEKGKIDQEIIAIKKESEEQLRKAAEVEVKKALGDQPEKKIDDLKKKFGL